MKRLRMSGKLLAAFGLACVCAILIGGGIGVYLEDTADDKSFFMRRGHYVMFDQDALPIPVYVNRTVHPQVIKALVEAIARINQVAGTTVFLLPQGVDTTGAPLIVEHGIFVKSFVPEQVRRGVTQPFISMQTNRIIGALVTLPSPSDPVVDYQIAVHELGHVLGLDHDAMGIGSMMQPYLDDSRLRLTKKDQQLIKDTYGGF